MPLNNAAVIQLGDAFFFHGEPESQAKPTLTAATTVADVEGMGWENFGHTSLEQLLGMNREGGELSSAGTWQAPSLFTVVSPVTESVTVNLAEWTEESLVFYYGANADVDADGHVAGSTAPIPTTRAFLMIVRTAGGWFGCYSPAADLIGDGPISFGERGSVPSMPVRVTDKGIGGFGLRWLTIG